MRPYFLILLSIILFNTSAHAQETSAETGKRSFAGLWQGIRHDSLLSFRNRKGFVPCVLHDFAKQASGPFRMTGKQALYVTAGAALTLTALHFDADIESGFRPLKAKHIWIRNISPQVTELGDYYGFTFLAAYGVFSIATKDRRALHTSMLAAQAAITAGVWARAFKILGGRMRPGATYNDPEFREDHWFGPFAQFNKKYNTVRGVGAFDAFPSGHTAAAFSMATAFAMQYRDKPAVQIIAYSLAGIVGVTRLVEHEHWASDVVAGGMLGYLCGRQVVQHYRKLFPEYTVRKKHRANSEVFLTRPKNGIGLGYALSW